MKRVFRGVLVVILVVVLGGAAWGGWWVFVDGRAPARRPDLVKLPEGAPIPPAGYPTEHAMYLAFALGRLSLQDLEHLDVPQDVVERKDIEYGKGGEKALLLDLYTPIHLTSPAPGLIFIHGGGWKAGQRSDYKFYTTHFAQQGYVAATVSYRFTQEAIFPAAVQDVKCAVRWMRANAKELGVDPDRIAVVGGSAGGYLSMMIGYTSDVPALEGTGGYEGVSSAVAAVVDIYGPTDLTVPEARDHEVVVPFMGKRYTEDPELYRYASPLTYVDAQDPPTLILQGTIDSIVFVSQSDMLAEKFQALKMPYWYARLDGWPHTMDLSVPVSAFTKPLLGMFFEEYLKKKAG